MSVNELENPPIEDEDGEVIQYPARPRSVDGSVFTDFDREQTLKLMRHEAYYPMVARLLAGQSSDKKTASALDTVHLKKVLALVWDISGFSILSKEKLLSSKERAVFSANLAGFVDDMRLKFPTFLTDPIAGDKGQHLFDIDALSDADVFQMGLAAAKQVEEALIPIGLSHDRVEAVLNDPESGKKARQKFVVKVDKNGNKSLFCRLTAGLDLLPDGQVKVSGMLDERVGVAQFTTGGLESVEHLCDNTKGVKIGDSFAALSNGKGGRDLSPSDYAEIDGRHFDKNVSSPDLSENEQMQAALFIGEPYKSIFGGGRVNSGRFRSSEEVSRVLAGKETLLGRTVSVLGFPEGLPFEKRAEFLLAITQFANAESISGFDIDKTDGEMIFLTFDCDLTEAMNFYLNLLEHLEKEYGLLKSSIASSSGMMPVRPAGFLSAAVDTNGPAYTQAAVIYKLHAEPGKPQIDGPASGGVGSQAEWLQSVTAKGLVTHRVSLQKSADGSYSLDRADRKIMRSNLSALTDLLTERLSTAQGEQLIDVNCALTATRSADFDPADLKNFGEGLGFSALGRSLISNLKERRVCAEFVEEQSDKVAPVTMSLMAALSPYCDFSISPGQSPGAVLSKLKSFDPKEPVVLFLDAVPSLAEDKLLFSVVLERLSPNVRIVCPGISALVPGDASVESHELEEFSEEDFFASVVAAFPQYQAEQAVLMSMMKEFWARNKSEFLSRYMLTSRLAMEFVRRVCIVKGEESFPLYELKSLPAEAGWTMDCDLDFYGTPIGQHVRTLMNTLGGSAGYREAFSVLSLFNSAMPKTLILEVLAELSPSLKVSEDLLDEALNAGLLKSYTVQNEKGELVQFFDLANESARQSYSTDLVPWSAEQLQQIKLLAAKQSLAFCDDLPDHVKAVALGHYFDLAASVDKAVLDRLASVSNEYALSLLDGRSVLQLYFFAKKIALFLRKDINNVSLLRSLDGQVRYELARAIMLYSSAEDKDLRRMAVYFLVGIQGEYKSRAQLLLNAESKTFLVDDNEDSLNSSDSEAEAVYLNEIGPTDEERAFYAKVKAKTRQHFESHWEKIRSLKEMYSNMSDVTVFRESPLDGRLYTDGFDGSMSLEAYQDAYKAALPDLNRPVTEDQKAIAFMLVAQYGELIYWGQKLLVEGGFPSGSVFRKRLMEDMKAMIAYIDAMEMSLPTTVNDLASAEEFRRYGRALLRLGRPTDLKKIERSFDLACDFHRREDSFATHEGLASLLSFAQGPFTPFLADITAKGLLPYVGASASAVASNDPGRIGSALRDLASHFSDEETGVDKSLLPSPDYLRRALESIENEYFPASLSMIRPTHQRKAYVAKFDLLLMAATCALMHDFEHQSEYEQIVSDYAVDLQGDVQCFERAGGHYPAQNLMVHCAMHLSEPVTESHEPVTDKFVYTDFPDGEPNVAK